jgi:two-component system, cell cycle response regulator DivK
MPEHATKTPTNPANPVSIRVLVVDDHPTNLRLITGVLESQGHTHATANDGQSALQMLEREGFDLVLLDIQMPGLSGTQVAERIRGNPTSTGLKLIAVTALAMPGDRDEILRAGFDGYVAKPFRIPELLEVMRRVFQD